MLYPWTWFLAIALANPYAPKPGAGPIFEVPPVNPGGIAAMTPDPFEWVAGPAKGVAGKDGRIVVRLLIPPDHDVWRDMVEVRVVDDGGLKLGLADLPPGIPVVEADGTPRERYRGEAVVWIPVGAAPAGTRTVKLALSHQGCRPGLCFPPKTSELVVTVEVAAAPVPLR